MPKERHTHHGVVFGAGTLRKRWDLRFLSTDGALIPVSTSAEVFLFGA